MPRTKAEKSKLLGSPIPPENYITRYGDAYVTFQQVELYHTPTQIQQFDEYMENKRQVQSDDGTMYIPVLIYQRFLEEVGLR